MKKIDVKKIAIISVCAAICSILYCYVKFPLPMLFPSFLDVNFSLLVIFIVLFIYGPIEGIIVSCIRTIMKLLLVGTGTAYVGEIADLVISFLIILAFSLSTYFLKKKNVSFHKRTILVLTISTLAWAFGAVILNWLVLVPTYIELFFKGNESILVSLCSMIPGINESNYMPLYLFVGCLPFNLLLGIIVSTITYFVYVRLYPVIQNALGINEEEKEEVKETKENSGITE